MPVATPAAVRKQISSGTPDPIYLLLGEDDVETAALAESFSHSLAEAAWRGDRLTVEVHLRQLRACVVNAIATFKDLDGPTKAAAREASL